jgi:hypothetical protein
MRDRSDDYHRNIIMATKEEGNSFIVRHMVVNELESLGVAPKVKKRIG